MRLDSLTLKNFRSYGEAEIDLTGLQLAAVVGENGAGKSSLMDGALFALTGARTRGNLDDWIRDNEEECMASATFAIGQERYRATRIRSRRNSSKSSVELCREADGAWVPDCTGADATEARIRTLLGADEDLLLMTSFISQGEAKRFLDLTPSKRLEVLGEILKLDQQYGLVERHWKAKAEEAKANLEDARREILRLEADVATLATREADRDAAQFEWTATHVPLVEAEKALQEARGVARAAEQDAVQAEGAKARLSDLSARRAELTQRKQTLTGQLATYAERITAKTGLEEQYSALPVTEEGIARLAEAERADAETRQARAVLETLLRKHSDALQGINGQGVPKKAELERLNAKAKGLTERITAIETAETPVCDRCGQAIADAALAQALDQLVRERTEVNAQATSLAVELEDLRAIANTELESRKAVEADIAALPALTYDPAEDRRLKNLRDSLNEIPAKLAEICGLEERRAQALTDLEDVGRKLEDFSFLVELAAAEKAAGEAEQKFDARWAAQNAEKQADADAKAHLQRTAEIERTIARHEEAIALLGPSRDKLTMTQAAAKLLEEDQADAELLRKAFSKWGVPALIIGNVLLALEREVNELMSLYEGGMTVRFEDQRETRDGSRNSLEIIIDREGSSREYQTFSGGEKYRIASCIRLGLAVLMAHRAGARIGTLILDEPEGLDAEGRQHLVKILEHLSGQFERTLLISHHDDLKDAMPSQVLVTRGDDGLSRVEVVA